MADEIYDQLAIDIKTAMKSGQKEKLDAIRFLKAALLENKTAKTQVPEMDVVVKHYKKLADAQTLYPGDSEQFKKIQNEMSFVKAYMPAEMDEAEVRALATSIVAKVGKNFGGVMKELSPQIKGKFDGKRASDIVKELLA